MKKREKQNILILTIISIIIIILELIYVNKNSNNILEQIDENEKLIGMQDVSGEGIIIHIEDGKDLIHQEDLIILLDELKNTGVEAISVNEQRITTNSYLYCDGSVILIDGHKIGNPFTIKAIGDVETIYGAMARNKGYIATLTNDGIKIDVEKSNDISICKTNKQLSDKLDSTNNLLGKISITNKLAGKTRISGSGIEIKINTEKTSDITAISLLQIINDLNSAGVSAISINENRIINMTDIMDINKEYILVDSKCVSSPYVIKAIGNTQNIVNMMNLENSTVSKLSRNGKKIEINKKWNLTIDEYQSGRGKNKLQLNYIK